MAEQYDIDVIECPGCKRRFRRADIKTDRIKCPTCGREIWAKVTVTQQDEHKLVEQFLNENGIGAFWGSISIPWFSPSVMIWMSIFVYVSIIVAILYTGFSFWRIFWVICILFLIKFQLEMCYGKGRKVRSFFERNGYDLEAGLAEYNKFISGLGELEREKYFYQGGALEKKMRTYVRAHVDVQNRFESYSAYERQDNSTSQYERIQAYDMPPDACPSCGAPYHVGDFNVHTVTCRKCGASIGVTNVVSDEELHDLLVKFVEEIKEQNSVKFLFLLVCFCAGMSIWNIFESGIWDFLYSWSVLWLYATVGFVWCIQKLKEQNNRFGFFLKQKRINLFEFEFYIKSEYGEAQSETAVFYKFKERLMDLYKKSASMVKGSELS